MPVEVEVPRVAAVIATNTSQIVGMGVVVSPSHVITCAHVVNYALGRDIHETTCPNVPVCVSLVLAPQEPRCYANTIKWLPPRDSGNDEDVVLLQLDDPFKVTFDEACFVLPRIDEPIRAFGVPDGSTLGTWWRGWISLPVRGSRFQLDQNRNTPVGLARGFSGTPLLSNNGRKAFGIVARLRDGVGYMIPSQELNRVYKILKESDEPDVEDVDSTHGSPTGSGHAPVATVSAATEQRDALIEVEVNADSGSFSDEDAFYFKKLIEYMRGFPNVRLSVSYIRRGSTILGFQVISERSQHAALSIVREINNGALERHGVVGAHMASPTRPRAPRRATHVSRIFRWKRYVDPLLAATLLLPVLPVLLLSGYLMRLTSRGPAIFRQTRIGANGRIFTMYKLRTMRIDAEALSGPVWATPNDPRVTPIGRFLRMTHLDELPELWNVVRGEMSLIGPRPERPEIAEVLSECVPDYETRLLVKPGIFGLHSLNFPPDTDVESVRTKLVVDRFYIERATVGMDVLIFLDVVRRFFGVPLRLTERFAERALGGKVDGGGFK